MQITGPRGPNPAGLLVCRIQTGLFLVNLLTQGPGLFDFGFLVQYYSCTVGTTGIKDLVIKLHDMKFPIMNMKNLKHCI